jgi:hypothetical protein
MRRTRRKSLAAQIATVIERRRTENDRLVAIQR